MNLQTLPGLFISHGSPMLALNPEQVGPALHRLSLNLPKPEAIIVMSAHWESHALEISTSVRAETWHDFRGFPAALASQAIATHTPGPDWRSRYRRHREECRAHRAG